MLDFLIQIPLEIYIAIGSPIFTLLIGYMGAIFNEERKRVLKLKSLKTFLTINLILFIESIEKQISYIDKFVDELNPNEIKNIILKFVDGTRPKLFEEIRKNEIFEVINYDRKIEHSSNLAYKNLVQTISYFEFQSESFVAKFETFDNKRSKLVEKINDLGNRIFRLHDEFTSKIKEAGIDPKTDEFYFKQYELIGEIKDLLNDPKVEELQEKLINPFKEICREHLDDPRSIQMLELLIQLSNIFKDFTSLINFYKIVFNKSSKTYSERLEKVKEAVKFLEERKLPVTDNLYLVFDTKNQDTINLLKESKMD